MRASLTMLCPPELRGAGRSRRTLNLVEDLVDDGAWRRIDVSSNSTLPPCVVARWVEERCDEQSRTFSPLAAEVYSKEHQRPQASSSGAPLSEVANGTRTEL
ncbi:BnaA06g35260D [Brassica napus]|uniref:BnaA06g35260D protein n=2 Tax=Brassica TaxID=3705 RepID=A0A078FY44_BRANA|nr:BnaA06g35260D [Brassica napus]